MAKKIFLIFRDKDTTKFLVTKFFSEKNTRQILKNLKNLRLMQRFPAFFRL